MTIAGKINLLFITVGLVLLLTVTGLTAWREYHQAFDRVVDSLVAQVHSRPDLQVQLYARQDEGLQPLLEEFLETPFVTVAAARDGLGELLSRREGSAGAGAGAISPPFKLLRRDLGEADTGLVSLGSDLEPTDTGLLSALRYPEQPVYLTVPVFTAVNPGQTGLTPYDFFVAPSEPGAKDSLRIIGYTQLEISRAALLDSVWPRVRQVFLIGLGLVGLFALIIALMSRRITRDLSRLAQLADDVSSGKVQKTRGH